MTDCIGGKIEDSLEKEEEGTLVAIPFVVTHLNCNIHFRLLSVLNTSFDVAAAKERTCR